MSLQEFFESIMEHQKKRKDFSGQAANFWMPDSYIDKSGEINLIELASVRRAVSNFCRIVTGKPIIVTYDVAGQSFTDQEHRVTLSANILNDEFDAVVALAMHESMHIVDTDMELMQRIMGITKNGRRVDNIITLDPRLVEQARKLNLGDAFNPTQKVKVAEGEDGIIELSQLLQNVGFDQHEFAARYYIKDLFNWIEDRRIDKKQFDRAPGYRPYYKSLYRKYFGNESISTGIKSSEYRTEDWVSYSFRIVNILNPNTDLTALKALPIVWEMLDVKNIKRLGDGAEGSRAALNLGIEIFAVVSDYVDPEKQQERHEQQKQEEEEQKKQNEELQKMMEQMSGQGEEEESKDPEDNTDDLIDSKQGEGKEEGTGKGEKAEGDGDDEETEDGKGDGGDKDEKEGKDKDGKGGKGKDKKDGEDGEEETDDIKGGKGDEKEDDKSDGDGDEKENEDGKGEEKEEEKPEPMTETQKEELQDAIKEQKKFMEGKVDKEKLSEEEAEAFKIIEQSGSTYENIGQQEKGTDAKVQVVRRLTNKVLKQATLNYSKGYSLAAVNEGTRLGKLLAKKLSIRNEERITEYTRKRSGKIDKRLLAGLGYGTESVCKKIHVDAYGQALAHISIDASGSMEGSKWYKTIISTVALCKAVELVENLDLIISFRATNSVNGLDVPLIFFAYDSRTENFAKIRTVFPNIKPHDFTPEGLCYEAVMQDILTSVAGKTGYFINYSDGEPNVYDMKRGGHINGYGGEEAKKQTKRQVDKMRAVGIKVLSFFLPSRDRNCLPDFQYMYGRDARNIDVTNITRLAREINKMFIADKM